MSNQYACSIILLQNLVTCLIVYCLISIDELQDLSVETESAVTSDDILQPKPVKSNQKIIRGLAANADNKSSKKKPRSEG